MGLICGIVGLPNAGKSTLFNALTQAKAAIASYPFTTIDPNVGVVEVPDKRLQVLAEITRPERLIPTTIKFLDIAGLVKDAHKGEGLGNQFLSHIREVDLIVEVVRSFEDANVVHVSGGVDPAADIEMLNLELAFADLEYLSRQIEKKRKDKSAEQRDLSALEKVKGEIEKGKPLFHKDLTGEELELMAPHNILTLKPMLYVVNAAGGEISDLTKEHSPSLVINAKLELEISELSHEEKKDFMGPEGSGLDRLIKTSYDMLALITFFTVKGDKTRAWTLRKGTPAGNAAGKVHSDMERGFICAEVISFDELSSLGSVPEAREKGLMRTEGKDYVIKDGDVVQFKFNV